MFCLFSRGLVPDKTGGRENDWNGDHVLSRGHILIETDVKRSASASVLRGCSQLE